tara:strand:+ start:166 stop:279 length:114 start_codon:yes stop_codon:yes gene_type:complete
MMSLYITGLIVGIGLGIMVFAMGTLIYLEHFNKNEDK